jgi:conjugative transposon TraN protein
MNWYYVIATVFTGSISFNLLGQTSISFSKSSYIVPYKLEVSYNKTTNLVFPASITSVDRGSLDIIVEKAVGVGNILRVKADARTFEETNLSVITNDGKLYSFLVNYNCNPSYLNVNIPNAASMNIAESQQVEEAITTSAVSNEHYLKTYSHRTALQKSNVRRVTKTSKTSLAITGIYVRHNTMFCRFEIENHSAINYDIDQFRLYIRDRNRVRRTAYQEVEMPPIYILGNVKQVKANENSTIVVALNKFTIPDAKYLVIEMNEKSGGRHLLLKLSNRKIMKARELPELN